MLKGASLVDAAACGLDDKVFPLGLGVGQTTTLTVRVSAAAPGACADTLVVTSDTQDVEVSLAASAEFEGDITAPTDVDFGAVYAGTERELAVVVYNQGPGPLTLQGAALSRAAASSFALSMKGHRDMPISLALQGMAATRDGGGCTSDLHLGPR